MTQTKWKEMFRDRLAGIMKERGMSQRQLAKCCGLSVSRINDYLTLKAVPTPYAAVNLAYGLDMSISDLIDFDERIDKDKED